jgi:5-carboxymethyl-2-hydroxymuconate isomerase
MINVTVSYTDNLGPEADIPALLARIAARLGADFGEESMVGVCIGAVRLGDFIVGDGRAGWASVAIVARLPSDRLSELRERLLTDLTALAETQLADFYRGRSLTISVELVPVDPANTVGRINIAPNSGGGY